MAISPGDTDEGSTGGGRRQAPPASGGFVHGGVWNAFGDSVAAWATFRALPAEPRFHDDRAQADVFSAGVLGDELICEARPLHVGAHRGDRARSGRARSRWRNLIVTQFVLPGRDPRAERPAPGDYPPGD